MPFDLKTWEGFKGLSKQGPEFLLDIAAINARTRQAATTALRWHTGTFKVPVDVSGPVFDRLKRIAGERWREMMAKRGWTLRSKLYLEGPFPCFDLRDQVVLPGHREYRIRGTFQKDNPQPVRYEVPKDLVKQDSEHRVSLKAAMAVDGLAAQPR